jgi:hypothetical protein
MRVRGVDFGIPNGVIRQSGADAKSVSRVARRRGTRPWCNYYLWGPFLRDGFHVVACQFSAAAMKHWSRIISRSGQSGPAAIDDWPRRDPTTEVLQTAGLGQAFQFPVRPVLAEVV